MPKYLFPAVFDPGEDGSEGYTVTFTDLPGCITEGMDLDESMKMARDALSGFLYAMEEDGENIPKPKSPTVINTKNGAFVVLIEAWTDIVREEAENRSTKKTLTIPKWLNDAAEQEGINFSQLLSYAIKERLGIQKRSS